MSNEATFSERMKTLRARHGLTQEEFAIALGFTRSYISQLESGVKEPGPKFLKSLFAAERKTSLTKSDSEHSKGPNPYVAGSVREGARRRMNGEMPAGVMMVPLISWAQGGIATDFDVLPDDWQEFIPAAVTDTRAFAITIRGDSMEPKYSDGDIAIVLPQTAPRNGDLVIAKIKEEGFAFKVLNLVGGDPNHIRLKSYNSLYEPMDLRREQFHWIYPVHSVNKMVRK